MSDPKVEKQKPVPPFVQFCCAAVPMVFDDSLSYYEALCAMWKYLDETVKVINNNALVTEDFIAKVEELKAYVEHYFDNLDVQEEINNKLDEMADDGTLQEIITAYIQANVAWTFDTVADMKLATNLVSGSYAQTLGFHSINDGGSALYKITDTGTADEHGIIAIGDLFANIVTKDHVTPEMYGAYGDGTHDDTEALQACVASMLPVEMTKTYLISSTLVLDESTSATIYSLPVEKYYNATIKGNVLPILETQRGACSLEGITFENTGAYSTLYPIVYLNNRSDEDVDTIVKRCNFRHNSLGLFIKGRNAVIEDNIFYDFNNTGSCIKLDYVQYDTDAENSSNINDFNRYKDGNRGFRIHHNRTHYTRNFLVDTTEASCQYIHGMEITDNYLEAGSLIKGYVENAQISNNITLQLYKDNYIIDATNMINVNISNNHWAGNNAFTTETGVSVAEASYQGAIISRGACKNCNITDNFVTNTRTGYVTILGSFTGRITGTVALTDVSFCNKYVGLDLCKQVSYAGSGTAKSIFMDYPYNIVEIWDYSGGTWSMRTLSSAAISLANYSITLDTANESSHSYMLKMFYSKAA